jgi:hypothetical protein
MPSPQGPRPSGPRASTGVKLVLMGVAGAALLYSCAPGVGAGLCALPYLWFLPNPFFRGPAISGPQTPGSSATTTTTRPGGTATTPGATTPDAPKATPSPTQSQRGGFGSTGTSGGSGGSS